MHLYDRREQPLGFQIIGTPGGYHGFPSEELGYVHADVQWRRSEESSR
jgi:hypothetical protein